MFLSGNATPLQRKLMEEWMAADPANVEQFYEWVEEWETEHPQVFPDSEQAWEKFAAQLDTPQTKSLAGRTIPLKKTHFWTQNRWLGWVAASVVLAITFVFTKDTIFYTSYQTAYGEIKTIQLEDGSRVVLNTHSLLRVPRFGFATGTREVFLEGEAEFSVTHKPDNQHFLVHTPDQLEVEVLGTEFVVYSRSKGSQVVLTKGKVQLRSLQSPKDKPLVIKPGDVVTVDRKGTFSVQSIPSTQNYTAWKEHRFVFDHTSLREVATLIEENFGVSVELLDSALYDRTLTGTFRAENASEMLQALSELMNLTIQKGTNSYTIKENP